jgi:transposase-like protein
LALVVLSVVEQRLAAVRAVFDGGDVSAIASGLGVHRSTVHRWVARYLSEGLAGLSDRSRRPVSCPHQVAAVVEVVVGMRASGGCRVALSTPCAGVKTYTDRRPCHQNSHG